MPIKITKIISAVIFCLVCLIISILEIFSVYNKNNQQHKLNKEQTAIESVSKKEFQLVFENEKCDSKEKIIYEYPDGKRIRSRCGEIFYQEDNEKHKLGDILKKQNLQIEDITKNMTLILGVYDGGTVVYQYNPIDYKLSNNSFKLEICKKINGCQDMLFLSSKSEDYICA